MSKLTNKRVDAIMRRFIDELREAFLEEAVEKFNTRGRDKLTKKAPKVKRTQAELDKLANMVLKRVRAVGGLTIETIAVGLGVETRELLLPIKQLKRNGLIRTTGHHRSTNYYAVK